MDITLGWITPLTTVLLLGAQEAFIPSLKEPPATRTPKVDGGVSPSLKTDSRPPTAPTAPVRSDAPVIPSLKERPPTLTATDEAAAAAPREPSRIITDKDFGKTIAVKSGELIEVRLPFAGSLAWATDGEPSSVRLVGTPRSLPTPDRAPAETLGGPMIWAARFQVTARPNTQAPLTLMYSDLGRVDRTKERLRTQAIPIPSSGAFLSQLPSGVFQEGTKFRLTLDVK